MKVLDAKVDWKEQYGNDPKLQVLVDSIPSSNEMVYESALNDELWYAEKGGYVSFYAGHPDKDGDGYGGRSYTLKTTDGEVVLTGPYSSRASVLNKHNLIQCVDVSITTDKSVLEKGYTFTSGSITVEKAREAMEHIEGAELRKTSSAGGEPKYIPVRE